jgi:hypothetical protein
MEHIAIQREDRTFDDWQTLPVLCRCKNKKDPPYGKVASGDIVYVVLGGEIKLRATVEQPEFQEYNDINDIRELCKGTLLYSGESYWEDMSDRRYATVVWLKDQEPLEPPIKPSARSYGSDWIVLDTPEKRKAWL